MPNLNFRMKRNNQLNQSNNIMNPVVNNNISISREKKVFFSMSCMQKSNKQKIHSILPNKRQGGGHGG